MSLYNNISSINMTAIPISKLHPNQALAILRVATKPDVTISLVAAILSRFSELIDTQKRKLFGQLLETRYDEMLHYARSQTLPRVKRTVSKVAHSLGHEGEGIQLWYEAFLHGDIVSLFELLDFLKTHNHIEKARNYILEAFNFSLDSYIAAHGFPHQSRESFYETLITYAYDLDMDLVAQEMVYLIGWELIESDDLRILRYKKTIRTPEEYDIALQGVWALYIQDDTKIALSPRNIQALESYIIWQIEYLWEHQKIEPNMLRHRMEGTIIDVDTEKSYDYRKMWWQLYFQMHMALLLAMIYRNPLMADAILEFIDDMWDAAIDMLADMLDSMNNPAEDEPIDDEISAEQKVCSEALLPMLDMFQWLEYTGLQERILSRMTDIAPTDARRLRDIYMSYNTARQFHLASTGIAPYYLSLRNAIDKKYTPVISKNIVDAVAHWVEYPEGFWDVDLIVYYLLEYMLLYGRQAMLSPRIIQSITTNIESLSGLEREFLGQFYPEYFL